MMTKKTAHIVLGVLVVISLIIISLPLFLSHHHKLLENPLKSAPLFPDQSEQVIPVDEPEVSPVDKAPALPAQEPVQSSSTKPTPATEPTAVPPQPVKPTPLAPEKISLNSLGKKAWAVEVGDYRDKITALRMVDELRLDGYAAFLQMKSNDTIHVLIGPEKEKVNATMLASDVNEKYHVQSMIIKYKPLML